MAKRITGAEGPESETDAIAAAQGLVLHAFMIEVMREFAWRESDRAAWVRQFIDRLHARIDERDDDRPADEWEVVHEMARRTVDTAGTVLQEELRRG